MDKEKTKQDSQQIEDVQKENAVKENVAPKSNRSLLWAIFSVLTVLVALLLVMIVLFVNGNRAQNDLLEKEQIKKEEVEKKESERQKEQLNVRTTSVVYKNC